MGKPTKYSNIYTRDGKLLRHVSDRGIIENWTIEETEELLDKLGKDVNEDGELNHPVEFNNCMKWLQHLYSIYGNPHEQELRERLEKLSKLENINDKLEKAISELKSDVESTKMDEYVDFEEVPEKELEVSNE